MSKNAKIITGISALVALLGVASWMVALNLDWSIGLTDYVAWGLAGAAFLVLEAVAAGTLFFSSFGRENAMRRKLLSVSLGASIASCVVIFFDAGNPVAFWRLFFAPHFQAPMALDVWFFSLAIVLGFVYLFALVKEKESWVAVLSKLCLTVSVLMPLGTSILFTAVIGRTGWSSPLEMVLFIVGSLVAGLCLVVLMAKEPVKEGRILLAALLGINAFLIAAEYAQAAYTTGFPASNAFSLISGQYAPLFWLWIAGGIALPLILLAFRQNQKIAAAIAIGGIAVGKYVFTVKGSLFAYAAQGQGVTVPSLDGNALGQALAPLYVPGLAEWGMSVGAVGLMVLIATVLIAKFDDGKTREA